MGKPIDFNPTLLDISKDFANISRHYPNCATAVAQL